jgi:hypothetical protein
MACTQQNNPSNEAQWTVHTERWEICLQQSALGLKELQVSIRHSKQRKSQAR